MIPTIQKSRVATREGGVDRNGGGVWSGFGVVGSPPARVAWIETHRALDGAICSEVATREGGVDRNKFKKFFL